MLQFQGFQKRYITFSWVNWLENGRSPKLEVQKAGMFYSDLCSTMKFTPQLTFFVLVDLGKGYIHLLKALKEENKDSLIENGGRWRKHMAHPVNKYGVF